MTNIVESDIFQDFLQSDSFLNCQKPIKFLGQLIMRTTLRCTVYYFVVIFKSNSEALISCNTYLEVLCHLMKKVKSFENF